MNVNLSRIELPTKANQHDVFKAHQLRHFNSASILTTESIIFIHPTLCTRKRGFGANVVRNSARAATYLRTHGTSHLDHTAKESANTNYDAQCEPQTPGCRPCAGYSLLVQCLVFCGTLSIVHTSPAYRQFLLLSPYLRADAHWATQVPPKLHHCRSGAAPRL